MIPTREFCALCHKVSPVRFAVPDEMWKAVVHPHFQNDILCLLCFITRADEKLLRWDHDIELFPVSLKTLLMDIRKMERLS